jgi:hypothetical protein
MPQLTLRQVPNTTAGGFFFWQLVKTGLPSLARLRHGATPDASPECGSNRTRYWPSKLQITAMHIMVLRPIRFTPEHGGGSALASFQSAPAWSGRRYGAAPCVQEKFWQSLSVPMQWRVVSGFNPLRPKLNFDLFLTAFI